MLTVQPDLSKGMFTRTMYDESTKKVKVVQNVVFNQFPAYNNWNNWNYNNKEWDIVEGDKVHINNNDSGNEYLWAARNFHQTTSYPILFRLKARGKDISGTPDYSKFGMYAIVTYQDDGLNGAGNDYQEHNKDFFVGTWDDQQYEIIINPMKPARWVYFYINAKNNNGELTVWDVEIIELNPNVVPNSYGNWESENIDLYRLMNTSIRENSLSVPYTVAFNYGDVSDVDGLGSVKHSIENLSKFDFVIIKNPNEARVSEIEVINSLVHKTKVFGYVHIGWTDDIAAMTDTELKVGMDSCADNGYYGIFFDMAGWDYGVTRDRLNTYVDYAHSKGLSVFANPWFPIDVLSDRVDSTFNPSGTPTSLGKEMKVQLNFDTGISQYIHGQSYVITVQDGYKDKFDLIKNRIRLNQDYITNETGKLGTIIKVDGYQITIVAETTVTDGSPQSWNGDSIVMKSDDWVLLESFYSSSNNEYIGISGVSIEDSIQKYTESAQLAHDVGVSICSMAYMLSYRRVSDTKDRDNSYLLSLLCDMDGWCYTSFLVNEEFVSIRLDFDTGYSTYTNGQSYTFAIQENYKNIFDEIKNKISINKDYITNGSDKFGTITSVGNYTLTIKAEMDVTDGSPNSWLGDKLILTQEAPVNRFNEDMKPPHKFGNVFTSELTKTAPNRWERSTDRGVVWFEATGNKRESGCFSTVDYLGYVRPDTSIINSWVTNAGRILSKCYTSDNGVDWVEWNKSDSVKRYVKFSVELMK